MFIFNEITKTFQEDFWKKPQVVLNNLSFSIEEGSITGFLGANGAGKTTSLKVLFRFIRPDSGSIKFSDSLGKDWFNIRKKIGFFPEHPYFYQYLSGREFIEYMAQLQGVRRANLFERLDKWAKILKIDHALENKIKTFSKGMLQRMGFLVSIIHRPRLLVLDEPLSGLDPIGRRDFKEIMKQLNNEGVTIFFSSHIVSDVEEVCDKLVVIDKGQLIYSGDKNILIDQNDHSLIRIQYYSDKKILDDARERKINDKLFEIIITPEEKDKFIKDIILKEARLKSFDYERPGLEQIIYRREELI